MNPNMFLIYPIFYLLHFNSILKPTLKRQPQSGSGSRIQVPDQRGGAALSAWRPGGARLEASRAAELHIGIWSLLPRAPLIGSYGVTLKKGLEVPFELT